MLVATAQQIVEHSLGGTPAVPYGSIGIVNKAGRLLVTMRPWRWLENAFASVDLVLAQDYAPLPADFGALRKVLSTGTFVFLPIPVDGLGLHYLREYPNIAPTSSLLYFDPTYRVIGNALVPVLDLFPPPSKSETGALRVLYRRTWADRSGDDAVILIPPWLDPLFEEVLRATARGTEEEDIATAGERLNALRGTTIYDDAAAQDSRIRVAAGTWRGGAVAAHMRPDIPVDSSDITLIFNSGNPS